MFAADWAVCAVAALVMLAALFDLFRNDQGETE
jgi:hypothetical protein